MSPQAELLNQTAAYFRTRGEVQRPELLQEIAKQCDRLWTDHQAIQAIRNHGVYLVPVWAFGRIALAEGVERPDDHGLTQTERVTTTQQSA